MKFMGIRVTIVLDENNDKQLRTLQAKKIEASARSVSYSKVINEVLKNGLKK